MQAKTLDCQEQSKTLDKSSKLRQRRRRVAQTLAQRVYVILCGEPREAQPDGAVDDVIGQLAGGQHMTALAL